MSDDVEIDTFQSECVEYIISMIRNGNVSLDVVNNAVQTAAEQHQILPHIVRMENFAEAISDESFTRIVIGEERCKRVKFILDKMIESMRGQLIASEVDTDTTAYSTDNMSSSSESDCGSPSHCSLHLNPQLPISQNEYTSWLYMCKQLSLANLMETDCEAPKKLLMLMSKEHFTPVAAVEAYEALHDLYNKFGMPWFKISDFKRIRNITKRALRILDVSSADGKESLQLPQFANRKSRLRSRRKVFKARKRIWDDETRRRFDLENQFGDILSGFKSVFTVTTHHEDPSWFKSLLSEHYASLEEQFARTLLEREYHELVSTIPGSTSIGTES